jgi:hypothetical protein
LIEKINFLRKLEVTMFDSMTTQNVDFYIYLIMHQKMKEKKEKCRKMKEQELTYFVAINSNQHMK